MQRWDPDYIGTRIIIAIEEQIEFFEELQIFRIDHFRACNRLTLHQGLNHRQVLHASYDGDEPARPLTCTVRVHKCCTFTRPLIYGTTPRNQELPVLGETFVHLIYRRPPQGNL